MSTRYNPGSHYQNHPRGVELHDIAAHAPRTDAEADEKQDHQTGQEYSRQALEHAQEAYRHTEHIHRDGANEHRIATLERRDVAELAHALWQARGVRKDRRKRIGSALHTN